MAKDSSFDVVSTVDMQEVDNAYQQATREIAQRYDLKGTGAISDPRQGRGCVHGGGPAQSSSRVRCVTSSDPSSVKRGVDLTALRWDKVQAASGMSVRQQGHLVQGIDAELAKRISKDIRDSKLKAKATIEGDKLRVKLSFQRRAAAGHRPASRQRLRPAPPVRQLPIRSTYAKHSLHHPWVRQRTR